MIPDYGTHRVKEITIETVYARGNALGVWLNRRSDGRIAGPSRGTTIGMFMVPGRGPVSIAVHDLTGRCE